MSLGNKERANIKTFAKSVSKYFCLFIMLSPFSPFFPSSFLPFKKDRYPGREREVKRDVYAEKKQLTSYLNREADR